jgi:lipoprotein-anchoring transpeptidase ErfK/SrfK
MHERRSLTRSLAACLVAAALVLTTTPALASTDPTVVKGDVFLQGTPMQGWTAQHVHDTIEASVTMPVMEPLTVSALGTTYTVDATSAVTVDATTMVAAAVASNATTEFDLPTSYAVNASTVKSRVTALAKKFNRTMVNAKRSVVKRKLRVSTEKNGRTLDQKAAIKTLSAAMLAEAQAGGIASGTIVLKATRINAKVTRKNIGRTIIVVLGQRKVYLYKATKLWHSYRCAIGRPSHPTPLGTFKVIAKNPHPSWTNPGSDWARGMPAYIPPGASNPLGLRALYLNASGIRIHGTINTGSIGYPESHGCIRLANANIVKLYPLVPVGTPVYIVK